MFHLRAEAPGDGPAIEQLLDRAFGPERRAKASYALRDGVPAVAELARVAVTADGGRLVGTVRYWPIAVGEDAALLLGPLGVEPARRGRGIGRALLRASLAAVRARAVLLVGDPAYYGPLGFAPAPPTTIMPGEDPARLLVDAAGPPPPAGTLRPWPAGARATPTGAAAAAE
ncbi:MAG: GNAT family N-acetyltransferase [Alphaproteobacteria bacterium]|jgi:predicted N-acetyltransferase YhbS|nr:GNAT family N-acetyltransferase [Alphaproteobacteria bacterium]